MRNDNWLCCPACDECVKAPGEDQIQVPLFVATCPHCGLVFDWRTTLCSLDPAWSPGRRCQFAGATFQWEEFIARGLIWDHEHCLGCWQKFMELDHSDVERFGFVTYQNNDQWWVCPICFDDFHEEMAWRIDPSGPPAPEPT